MALHLSHPRPYTPLPKPWPSWRKEGGVEARYSRYLENQQCLVEGMRRLGFETLLPDEIQSPIITSFLYPSPPDFKFNRFYQLLKEKGFVVYPGKVTGADTFRIGTIGEVYLGDVHRLLEAVKNSRYWLERNLT